MPLYTFNMFREDGVSTTLEMFELPDHRAAFDKAGDLLTTHLTCNHVEVWHTDWAVVARYRHQPIIRPVDVSQPQSSLASWALRPVHAS